MDSDRPDPRSTDIRDRGSDDDLSGNNGAAGDTLADLLARWEERYFQHHDIAPEALGVHDPSLIQALRDRIIERKRLYAFMGLSSHRETQPPAHEAAKPVFRAELPRVAGPTKERDLPIDSAGQVPVTGRYKLMTVLGRGAFGTVYLAHDTELDRPVAIKLPNQRAAQRSDAAAYPTEARVVAALSHPNIVPIYDVGQADDGRCFIVSKYIDDGDLASKLKIARPAFSRSAQLIAVMCDALHYAHAHDCFHRDIKPANILIDTAGVPFLTDFGLALKDEDIGTGPHHLGTPAFMSPEQARGEGHLVDGRSDIFSLGVVFYVMLTGRRPFRGATRHQMIHQIINSEPRPPRQIDDKIPRELERICLKAIAKRASERYPTAGDMADDLREFLNTAGPAEVSQDLTRTLPAAIATGSFEATPTATSGHSEASPGPIRIVPKGLCSFDKHDADFFLELLPGPRDRNGFPSGLRFWKTRIEATDPDKTFRVGLIYGPSGCGKSSLIKAGLLPSLDASQVSPVYVEATAKDTEAHLLARLRNQSPGLPADAGLVATLAAIRRTQTTAAGSKVLLVLDQFEQWLFARGNDERTDLVAALRQCDGERLQALCLVRDDFWMAATRFMRDLEIDLVPDRNVAAVDLFDVKHARNVLTAYGRAYETLAPGERDLTREQKSFLAKATSALAQDGRIVPVRLALFAEMIKNKPWTPATLQEVGGMDGVGVKFLDDSFTSPRSNPIHRYHQTAAKAVLESLLPETNADIKGRMRSIAELRDISGYADRPTDFAGLMQILDRNLRLITPVDLQSSIGDDESGSKASERYYQLTHDYLVHSLRNWVNKEKKATRRGRAELLLAERAGLWNAKPEIRYLPSVGEWATIRLLAKPASWTEPQRRMMRRAGRVHGTRLIALVAALCLVSAGAVAYNVFSQTERLLDSLSTATVEKIPNVLNRLSDYPRWTYSSRLRDLAMRPGIDDRAQLGYRLALLPGDPHQFATIYNYLLKADPAEMTLIRDRLEPLRDKLTDRLWKDLRSAKTDDASLLPIAGALARYDLANPGWAQVADKIVGSMVKAKLDEVKAWREAVWPVRAALIDSLARIGRDKARPEVERSLAADMLAHYASDRQSVLVDLLLDSDAKAFSILFPSIQQNDPAVLAALRKATASGLSSSPEVSPRAELGAQAKLPAQSKDSGPAQDQLAARAAKAAVTLIRLGHESEVWRLLEHSSDPSRRSEMIGILSSFEVSPSILGGELKRLIISAGKPEMQPANGRPNKDYLFNPELSKRRALILALAEYAPTALSRSERTALVATLVEMFHNDPDAGIHSAAELVLSRWGFPELVQAAQRLDRGGRRWYVNRQGQTMVLVDGPVEFDMGSPPDHPDHQEEEIYHRRIIPRRFFIASKEVTTDEFQRYSKATGRKRLAQNIKKSDPGGPQVAVSWFEAVEYCNWLSDQEKLPHCYLPNKDGDYAAGMRINTRAVAEGGYRLHTEAEWEYACRAGAVTSRYYGNSPELLAQYEWYAGNSGHRPHPCGKLRPNDFGLFDMLGNVMEWCHDLHPEHESSAQKKTDDLTRDEDVTNEPRFVRSDRFSENPFPLHCAARGWFNPRDYSRSDLGFRPARTLPP